MHPLYKILAQAAGRNKVKPGEFVIEPHKTPDSCLVM